MRVLSLSLSLSKQTLSHRFEYIVHSYDIPVCCATAIHTFFFTCFAATFVFCIAHPCLCWNNQAPDSSPQVIDLKFLNAGNSYARLRCSDANDATTKLSFSNVFNVPGAQYDKPQVRVRTTLDD